MRKIILIFTVIIFLSNFSIAQNLFNNFDIIDAGTNKLTDKEANIIVKEIYDFDDYFILITPHISNSDIYIAEKNKNYFKVKSEKCKDCSFDYLIIRKRTKKLEDGITEEDLNLKKR